MYDVCYHHTDFDGIAAAAQVPAKKYVPVNYNSKLNNSRILDELHGKRGIIVDFSFPITTMRFMSEIAKELVWIDHHLNDETKAIDHELRLNGVFTDEKSGCELTWHYLKNRALSDPTGMPESLKMVGDRDIRANKIKYSRAYCEGLTVFPGAFNPLSELWQTILKTDENTKEIIDHGMILVQKCLTDNIWQTRLRTHVLEPEGIIITNCTHNPSDLGDYIIAVFKREPVIMWDVCKDQVAFHFRGTGAQELAEQLGGGGHPLAAGYKMPMTQGLQLIQELYKRTRRIFPPDMAEELAKTIHV